MPRPSRHQRLINALNHNASQSIYRLSPELIGEIFLLARPGSLVKDEGPPWSTLVRYLVGITSITGHFRRIALDFGELWSVMGFSLGGRDTNRCRVALVVLGAFLERARRCNLHFWFIDTRSISQPTFYSRLVTLIKPHAGRIQTFYFLRPGGNYHDWEELSVLFNDTVNLNKLALYIFDPSLPPLRITETLRKLKKLSLEGFVYDPSLQETMQQVEMLDLKLHNRGIADLHQWLEGPTKLKRLILPDKEYRTPQLINRKPLVRLEDLTYLHINFQHYQSITPWISLPNLRHLYVNISQLHPTPSHFEPKGYHYPPLRTLRMALSPLQAYARDEAALIIMNPQLEYLEMNWGSYEGSWVLSELSDVHQELMLPSGAPPTFPGPCLKYLRLSINDSDKRDLVPLSKSLSSILAKDSQLKLDLISLKRCLGYFERLMEQFPSQVKCYETWHCSIPLDELHERSQRE